MDQYLTVNMVTPASLVYDHHAAIIVVCMVADELGILPKHAPIIAPLTIDEVCVKRADPNTYADWIAVNGGTMGVCDNVVSIIADSAERERDIDVSRAGRARQRAECQTEEAKAKQDTNELKRATAALR